MDGSFEYDTNGVLDNLVQNEAAIDTFTYVVENSSGEQAVCRTLIAINGLHENPVAWGESVAALMNQPVTVNVLSNDSDPNGEPLAVTLLGRPDGGTADVNPDGTITFTPAPAFLGTAVVRYLVEDPHGGSDIAELRVSVTTDITWDLFNNFSKGFDRTEIDADGSRSN